MLCGIVVHLSDQRFDTYTAPSNDTQATDSTTDVPVSIQRQWSFQLNGGGGQVNSASIVATSTIPASAWNGPVPPFTATAAPLQSGQFLGVSSGVTTATGAPGFSSSRTVSPLLIPPGGGTQVLTASFTVDSAGLSFVQLSLTPNQSGDTWSFTSSSDPADTSSVNANPGGGLSVSLNNPTPGITYTFTFTGMVTNYSAQAVPSKPFLGLEAVSFGTPVTSVMASSYSLIDPVLEGTVTYSFDSQYSLSPSMGSQFGVDYPNGPDPTSSGVGCSPASVVAGQPTTCNVQVTDTSGSFYASPPTGAVTWSTNGSGTFGNGGSCTLVAPGLTGPAFNTASCSVSYTPTATPFNPVRTDTVTATYGGDSTHTGSVSFYPGMGPGPFVTVTSPPTALLLTPMSPTGTVGTSDTVTAALSGGADSGQPVVFGVSGADSTSGSCTTDSTGACSFTYTGPARPGSDTINACFDSNGNGRLDSTDSPCATLQLTWKLPPATLFAANAACGSANGLLVNGSHISVGGNGEHSNGSLFVNGSWNTAAFGSFGGPNGCKATVNGSGNTFQGAATPLNDPTSEPLPVDYSQQSIPCTFSAASFTFNVSNTTIPAGVYCATGAVTLNGSNDSGNVTVIAQKIVLNGSGYKLTPSANGLLLYQKGNAQLSVNGSGSSLSGSIFAPAATIVLNGSSTTKMSGPVEGLNVTLNGSNWSIG